MCSPRVSGCLLRTYHPLPSLALGLGFPFFFKCGCVAPGPLRPERGPLEPDTLGAQEGWEQVQAVRQVQALQRQTDRQAVEEHSDLGRETGIY